MSKRDEQWREYEEEANLMMHLVCFLASSSVVVWLAVFFSQPRLFPF